MRPSFPFTPALDLTTRFGGYPATNPAAAPECATPIGSAPRGADFGQWSVSRPCVRSMAEFELRLAEFGAWPGYMAELQPDALRRSNKLQHLPLALPSAAATQCNEQTLSGVPLSRSHHSDRLANGSCFWYVDGGIDRSVAAQMSGCRTDQLCAPCTLVREPASVAEAAGIGKSDGHGAVVLEHFICGNGRQPYAWLEPAASDGGRSSRHILTEIRRARVGREAGREDGARTMTRCVHSRMNSVALMSCVREERAARMPRRETVEGSIGDVRVPSANASESWRREPSLPIRGRAAAFPFRGRGAVPTRGRGTSSIRAWGAGPVRGREAASIRAWKAVPLRPPQTYGVGGAASGFNRSMHRAAGRGGRGVGVAHGRGDGRARRLDGTSRPHPKLSSRGAGGEMAPFGEKGARGEMPTGGQNCPGRGEPGQPGRAPALLTWPASMGALSLGHQLRSHADYQLFDRAPRRANFPRLCPSARRPLTRGCAKGATGGIARLCAPAQAHLLLHPSHTFTLACAPPFVPLPYTPSQGPHATAPTPLCVVAQTTASASRLRPWRPAASSSSSSVPTTDCSPTSSAITTRPSRRPTCSSPEPPTSAACRSSRSSTWTTRRCEWAGCEWATRI